MRHKVDLTPGIKEPLCGWEWVSEHATDDMPPVQFELLTPNGNYKVTAKTDKVLNEVIKALK